MGVQDQGSKNNEGLCRIIFNFQGLVYDFFYFDYLGNKVRL